MATKAELKARLSLDTSLFSKGIATAHSAASGLTSSFGSLSSAGISVFAKLAAAAAALGGAAGFALATKNAFELGKSVTELSSRTGIGVQSVVKLEQVFKDAGLEAADLGLAINRMQRYIETAGGKGKLGEEFQRIKNLAPEEQFLAIAESIRSIEDPAKRAQVAMEIFGRGGGKILPVIMDPHLLDEAIRAIGPQARLLEQNSAIFQRVAIQLEHAGITLRGFFVGVAAGIAGPLSAVLEKLTSIDLSQVGIKFGQELVKGAQMLVGFFKQPELFSSFLATGFQTAVLGLGNVLIAVFDAAIKFFKTGMFSALAGIGSMLLSTLLKAFATAVAYLQAGIENALEFNAPARAATAVIGHIKRDLATLQDQASNETNTARRQEYEEHILELKKQLVAAEEQLAAADKSSLESTAERAKRILDQPGGPRFGITGEGQTADELQKAGEKQLNDAMAAMAEAIKSFSVKDVTGAGEALKKAGTAAAAAVEAGGKAIASALGGAAAAVSTTSANMSNAWRLSGANAPMNLGPATAPYTPPYLSQPGTALSRPGNPLDRQPSSAYINGEPLFRKDSVLSNADKESLVDQFVAQGGERPTSSPEAYHAVKAGDDQRRQDVQRQQELSEARGKLGLETTNDILKNIKSNTDALK